MKERPMLTGAPMVDHDGLNGWLIRAGTFTASGEEVTGYVVSCTREELESVKRLPMYQRVVILPREVAK